jgi:hypothetical protein
MVNIVVKPLNTEIALSAAANTVYASKAVRVVNIGANMCLITVAGAMPGSFTLPPSMSAVIPKQPTDTLICNTNSVILATPVGYF